MKSIGWKIDKRSLAKKAVRNAAADGLGQFAEGAILTDSNAKVPIEEGTLERSGETDLDRDALKASAFYDTPYAVKQHEDTTLRHDEGRQAKFLQSTLQERGKDMAPFIASHMKKALP